ncbi:MAG: class I tRNA ligase family protein [bacterium]|nr:class I tRNA ligase family protein [bacterium]
MTALDKAYNHAEVEEKIYQKWLDSGYFNPDNLPDAESREPFTISLPPPNVTGVLHMGHAFEDTIQDAVIRYQRMKGKRALWLPGTDHAAVATQAKFEKDLYKKEKKTRRDFPRQEFIKMINDFALQNQTSILSQLHKLGLSLDWSRLAYTFDEQRELAVRTTFKKMFEAGLIYRGSRIVNWDPNLQTTVSDDEIEYKEQADPFYCFKYGPFTIGTVRPETKFGDKYVVINPKDKRYKKYKHGDKINLEWINGPITATVLHDPEHDMEFGTGCMTITPWHDTHDFDLAQKFGLEKEQVIDERGILLPIANEFAGMHIKKARPLLIEKLKEKGLVEKVDEKYVHRVATNMRGGGIIEPQIKLQWFVDVNAKFKAKTDKLAGIKQGDEVSLKEVMKRVVEKQQIVIMPERFEKIYYHWIDNLRDWCISRQIVYGHQIPIWYKKLTDPVRIKYFVHGTTKDNEAKKSSGHYDVELSERGEKEILELKKAVAEEKYDAVFCSDLQRARVTADTGFGGKTKIVADKRLREIDYGEMTRQDENKINKLKRQSVADPFPGGESYKDVENRMRDFLLDIGKKYPGKKIAIVAHQGPQRALDVLLKKYTWAEAFDKDWRNTKSYQHGWDYELKELTHCGVNAPEGAWEQDPDTLDTWFSSGLWTFSTLGWPKETSDMKIYHPTSVMMPGYEILFFWVARMILMSGFLLGDIPFHKVFLHGMVRDKQGRKFSKSLNNGVDPLDMTAKYGTDALRMALVFGAAPGNDVAFDEQKVNGMKHFANKLWNISRYVLSNVTNSKFPYFAKASKGGQILNSKLDPITDADKNILTKLEQTVKKVTEDLEAFRLHEAAQEIYQFTWHELADVYIEKSKEQLKDEKLKDSTLYTLHFTLLTVLKLLHPFMPFITEEIWNKLDQKELLIVSEWPR